MFHKDTFRLIRKTRKRFITLLLIVLIGASFMVGLMSSRPTMLASVDRYYKQTDFMDLQLYSSYGFDEGDIAALKDGPGVKSVVGTKFIDAYAYSESGGIVTRIQELECDLNRYTLTEGRMPAAPDEALALGSSSFGGVFNVGDVAKMYLEGDDPLSDNLAVTEYKIVGIVKTPQYMASSRETSTLNNLALATVIYVDNANFLSEYYTSLYLTLEDAEQYTAFTDGYKDFVESSTDRLQPLIDVQEKALCNKIITEVEQEIADGEKELAEETAKAEKEIADAKQELADALIKLQDGERELTDGWNKLHDGEKEMAEGEKELNDGRSQLDRAKEQIITGLSQQGVTDWNGAVTYANNSYNSLVKCWPVIAGVDGKYTQNGESIRQAIPLLQADIAAITQQNNRLNAAIVANTEKLNDTSLSQAEKDRLNRSIIADETTVQANKAALQGLGLQVVFLQDSRDTYGSTPLRALTLSDQLKAMPITDAIAALQATVDGYKTNIEQLEQYIYAVNNGLVPNLPDENKAEEITKSQARIAQLQGAITLAEMQKTILSGFTAGYGDPAATTVARLGSAITGQLANLLTLCKSAEEINKGQADIDRGRHRLNDGKQELTDARIKLENARIDLDDGWAEYNDGLKELADGEKELKEETEKALIDIAKAKQELADLPDAGWTVLDRDMHFSTSMFESNSGQMGKIGMVFPLLFFLVAALVCMTTMKRLVDEERGQIGIFSALGFSKGQIISKYVIYAFAASIVGSIVAIPLGMAVFPTVVYFCWRLMYDLPEMALTMPWYIAVLGVCAFTLIMVGVTFIVVRGTLKENPSMLMRPKAPKNAKKVFLENIGFIWKRLSFTSKVTARNIIRYKSRFFMTVIGVAGCTGLLVLGFAIKDSVSQVVTMQYNDLILYESTINVEEDISDEWWATLTEHELEKDENVEKFVPNLTYSAKVTHGEEEGIAEVYVTAGHKFHEIFNIRDRKTKKPLQFNGGAIVSEKFAELNNISVGDTVTMESYNEIRKEVTITGICEMYAGHYLFMTDEDYSRAFGERAQLNSVAVQAKNAQKLVEDYSGNRAVKSVSDFTAMKSTFNNMFDSLNIIILVIILCAGSLALVVIMNLTEVNISERIREIATLKVLGFNNSEVYSYIFKEVFILSLIGIIIGLPLGRIELIFVMSIIDMEMVMFPTIVKTASYIYSFSITIAFTILVILLMRKTLRNVKMVESLKSVE